MKYVFYAEGFDESYPDLEPLYRMHYQEMADRLKEDCGLEISPYNPRLDQYSAASRNGTLLTFVVRCEGQAVGYANVYVVRDMHNQDLIAREDTVFIVPDHRNGVGKQLVKVVLNTLKEMGVQRVNVTAMTDLRVAKLWKRMGFKETAVQMTYTF